MPKPKLKPPPREDEEEKPPSLADIREAADPQTAKEVAALLAEADVIQLRMKEDQARQNDIKAALIVMIEAWEWPKGVRSGRFGLEYHGWKTKRTLDVQKLLENGVDPEVIKGSYSESKPFVSSRFFRVR